MNDAVARICKAHIEPRRNDCKGCPLRNICHNGPIGTFGLEPINKHRDRMNAEADRIENETRHDAIVTEAEG